MYSYLKANTHTVPVTDPEILAAVGNVEVNSSNVDIDSLNKVSTKIGFDKYT